MHSEKNSEKYLIFQVNSTPEVDLAGTAVVSALKKAHPERKIVVVTNFVEVWLHNPDVFRVYRIGQTPYFHEEFIANKDSLVFAQNPLLADSYIKKESHLIDAWCEMCGVERRGAKPHLHFTQRESEVAWRLTKTDKPIFLMQPYETFGVVGQNGLSWTKDLPASILNEVVHKISAAGFLPVMIKDDNQPHIHGCEVLKMNLRLTMAAVQFSEKRLFVDSFMQAVAAALELPSTVTWLAHHPKNRGYELHDNIVGNIDTDLKKIIDNHNHVLDHENQTLNKIVDLSKVYDADEIITSILNQKTK